MDDDLRLEMEILPVSGPAPRESVRWIRPPELPGVHAIVVENTRALLRMFHTTFSMTAITRARAQWACRGATHRIESGEVAVWEPGDFHRCLRHFGDDEIRGGDATSVQTGMVIRPETLEAYAEEAGVPRSRLHVRMGTVRDPEVYASQRAFYDTLERPATALERQSKFAQCLSTLFEWVFEARRAVPEGEGSSAVRRVRRLIEERCEEDLRLEELASAVGLTRFQLLRLFKRHAGTTPHQYQIEVRVSRARERLWAGEAPATVAAALGFADQSHFNRHFKRFWGVTPGAFLKL